MGARNRGVHQVVVVAALSTALSATAGLAGDEVRVHGDAVVRTDEVGRVVLAVDVTGPDGFGDGLTDELYLLAPAGDAPVEVPAHGMSGEVVWSKSRGFVALVDERGVERITMTTGSRAEGESRFVGVELVRVVGSFGTSPWATDTSAIASTRTTTTGSEPSTAAADDCQSGGPGAVSCSRRCAGLVGGAGGTACDVSCGSGYYACCGCTMGLVAQCVCRVAPRDDIKKDPDPYPDWPCKICPV